MKNTITLILAMLFLAFSGQAQKANNQKNNIKMEELVLTQKWDKTFPKSDKVNHSKVTFPNRYGITLAADLYVPKDATASMPAIAVCGPFGAVKTQEYSCVPSVNY